MYIYALPKGVAEIRLAIAGIGNCASALVQGLYHYATADDESVGLKYPKLGGYTVPDIQPVCGFDVDQAKTGKDIGQAIFEAPNCTESFAEVPEQIGAPVYRSPELDGVANHMCPSDNDCKFDVDTQAETVDVVSKLQAHDADILICYLPVGASEAVRHYASSAIEAEVGFVNAIPEFIASEEDWASRFERAGVPVVGDDIKSQVGATVIHRNLVQLFENRGVDLTNTYQLNVGGNTDFRNMLDGSRLGSKKTSKTEAVNNLLEEPLNDDNIHIGPSDFVPFLDDQKTAFVRLKGEKFGGSDIEIDIQLRVKDSPNSAGSAVDAIRCAKIAIDRGIGGALEGPSAYTMKHPPRQMTDAEAENKLEAFSEGA